MSDREVIEMQVAFDPAHKAWTRPTIKKLRRAMGTLTGLFLVTSPFLLMAHIFLNNLRKDAIVSLFWWSWPTYIIVGLLTMRAQSAFSSKGLFRPFMLTLYVNRLSVRFHRHHIAWGEVDAITMDDGDMVFHMDDGRAAHAGLDGLWLTPAHAQWLVARLQQRLEQLAPGSPDDIPDVLDDLLGGPT